MIIKKITLSILFFIYLSLAGMEEKESSLSTLEKLPTELIFNILVTIDNFDNTVKTIKNLNQINKNFRELLYNDIKFNEFLINHLAKKFNKNYIFVALCLRTEGAVNWLSTKTNSSLESIIDMISKELNIDKIHAAATLGTTDSMLYLSQEIKNLKEQKNTQIQKLLMAPLTNISQSEPLLTKPEYLLLDLASKSDQLSLFAMICLLECGVNINIEDDRPIKIESYLPERATEKTPLIIAAESGNIKAVKLFTKYINKKGSGPSNNKLKINREALGASALEYAIRKGFLKIVKILAPFRKTKNDLNLLFNAIDAEKDKEAIINFLISQNIDINKHSRDYNETALMKASAGCDINIVNLLINNGANINSKNKYGQTALVYAIKAGNLEIVKLLLSKDAKVNLIDKFYNNYTPLMIAIDKRYPKIALELISANADINKIVEYEINGKSNRKKEIRCVANLALKNAKTETDANKLDDWEELLKLLEEKKMLKFYKQKI